MCDGGGRGYKHSRSCSGQMAVKTGHSVLIAYLYVCEKYSAEKAGIYTFLISR